MRLLGNPQGNHALILDVNGTSDFVHGFIAFRSPWLCHRLSGMAASSISGTSCRRYSDTS